MEKLDNQGLQLVSVGEILNESFSIPAYQRGYRWTERQVIDLLEDILEFAQKPKKDPGEFYCLQPIVLTKKGKDWLVIDGQQRLTTIYIILKVLEDVKQILLPASSLFSLSYKTRKKSKDFLENIITNAKAYAHTENADFYHMSGAYHTIKNWIEEKEKSRKLNRGKFLNTILETNYQNEIDTANNIRFIWYNVAKQDEDNDKKIFRKINMGKIPLTNAELIKALFFINSNCTDEHEKEKRQNQLAYEWNAIEDELQNDDFWFFLSTENSLKPTRIDFLFELSAKNKEKEIKSNSVNNTDHYRTFYIFNSLINEKKYSPDVLWQEIKTYFRKLKEWFDDNTYYHLIGYLIHSGKSSINDIVLLSKGLSKSHFKKALKEKIRSTVAITIDIIPELDYFENKETIKNILLLFNVVSTMNAGNICFPFKRYAHEQWSLEHIHAQNSENLKTDKQRKLVLEEQKKYYQKMGNNNYETKIGKLLEQDKVDEEKFNTLQNEIFCQFSDEKGIVDNSIANLTLLSFGNNAALSNNIFPVKRDKIIEMDTQGSFIPLCTKNVFLKYYSAEVEQNVIWTQKDRDAYLKKIMGVLCEYLQEETENGA